MKTFSSFVLALLVSVSFVSRARAEMRTFDVGSLVIPMDLTYQDDGLLQSYGLVFALLQHGIPVAWVIDPDKTWHAAACDALGDECAWDCAIEGSGVKCPYPTASPDLYAATTVVWDGAGALAPGTAITQHGYRGGPFVVAAAHHDAAMAIVDAWNDKALWAANPWAARTVFAVVSVHATTAASTGFVAKDLLAAPTIAVFSDGNEDIATSYLRAAGIPQSNGTEFPAGKCGASDCGPGTLNPDMLTVPSVAGAMGTCEAPSANHKNGALFTQSGLPAYCQIMSMHWNVADRETVQCNGGACPATQAQCTGQNITYHGHEVVAEVRSFLKYPVHFFAECQAVNAYENTTPNPAWPFLDDAGRDGHFLTTTGTPPPCPCSDSDFACVPGGCGGADCCLPKDAKEKGAGFLIAAQPDSSELQVLRPNVPYNQLDGAFATTGGSEPAYNLSDYLGTTYKNDREVTFLTGKDGPGQQDVWMSGYADGTCDIGGDPEFGGGTGECATGKVSYLGGHKYDTAVPISAHPETQGTRLFLNALFEADCVTAAGQPAMSVTLGGPLTVAAASLPVDATYTLGYSNAAGGAALDAVLRLAVPTDVAVVTATDGAVTTTGADWSLGAVSGVPTQLGDPDSAGTRMATTRFATLGERDLIATLQYRVGATTFTTAPATIKVRVVMDTDGDGVADDTDPQPNDAALCGDSDQDSCDDCSQGKFDPKNDGVDTDGDGICDAGETPGGDGGGGGGADLGGASPEDGCGCRTSGAAETASGWALVWLCALLLRRLRAPTRAA